ncbi:hypothetical protein RHMOL_Rhmol09G0161400 [Rhododendron molle]|uniref:Uncharacterized protein n=1 Tax=Rhododendron molle TaxID=49168 RepID=A0ACC0MF47_RHOML|nr:hypothetical protein RHMOL_Rhmol09G0161400 [Rhododendron molle]
MVPLLPLLETPEKHHRHCRRPPQSSLRPPPNPESLCFGQTTEILTKIIRSPPTGSRALDQYKPDWERPAGRNRAKRPEKEKNKKKPQPHQSLTPNHRYYIRRWPQNTGTREDKVEP